MAKRERIEDLGVTENIMKTILDMEIFDFLDSKHELGLFAKKYGFNEEDDEAMEHVGQLHREMRLLKDNLWQVYAILHGDHE